MGTPVQFVKFSHILSMFVQRSLQNRICLVWTHFRGTFSHHLCPLRAILWLSAPTRIRPCYAGWFYFRPIGQVQSYFVHVRSMLPSKPNLPGVDPFLWHFVASSSPSSSHSVAIFTHQNPSLLCRFVLLPSNWSSSVIFCPCSFNAAFKTESAWCGPIFVAPFRIIFALSWTSLLQLHPPEPVPAMQVRTFSRTSPSNLLSSAVFCPFPANAAFKPQPAWCGPTFAAPFR